MRDLLGYSKNCLMHLLLGRHLHIHLGGQCYNRRQTKDNSL